MRSYHVIASTAVLLLVVAGGVQAQGRGHEKNKNNGRGQEHAQPAPPSPAEQDRRAGEERARVEQYRERLNQQTIAAQQRAAALQQQRRMRQYQTEQEYMRRLRAQQERAQQERVENERGIYAPYVYRYHRAGRYYQTSQYGADLLRQAVRYGYQEGFRAGEADRMDGRRFDYADTFAYQDANYGYAGLYVPEGDYNYYFREGFQRGYEDGYYRRQQYGIISGGAPAILANVLTSILGLATIR